MPGREFISTPFALFRLCTFQPQELQKLLASLSGPILLLKFLLLRFAYNFEAAHSVEEEATAVWAAAELHTEPWGVFFCTKLKMRTPSPEFFAFLEQK